jgi:hypothetical protein
LARITDLRYAPKPVLAMVAVAVALVAAAVYAGVTGAAGGASDFTYPKELPGGYKVARILSGEEAVKTAGGIHWNKSKVGGYIKKAVIVLYEDGTRLWIAYTGPNACQLVDRMAEKIAEHEQERPYSRPFQHQVSGVRVYFTVKQLPNGAQQLHAFWCKGESVVWLEIGAAGSTPQNLLTLLEQMVNTAGYSH